MRIPSVAPTIETGPFPHGSRLMHGGEDQGWSIENDGATVTLTHDREDVVDSLNLAERVGRRLRKYPAMGKILDIEEVEHGFWPQRCRIPTLRSFNGFMRDLFRGLQVADISYIQTAHAASTPIEEFMSSLNRNEMATSLGPDAHLHDLLVHGIGVGSTPHASFEAFRALWQRREEITAGYEPKVAQLYLCALGEGFDISTGFVVDPDVRRLTASTPQYYLLGATLTSISTGGCPEQVAERAGRVVTDLGMGAITATHNYDNSIVPWEADNLPAHYQQVIDRISQP